MLNRLKNLFPPMHTEAAPAHTETAPQFSPAAAEVALKGKQLLAGRAKVRRESLRADLEQTRHALAQAKQTLGERLVDELDSTGQEKAMREAQERVRVLEAALTVAIEKDEAAQAALKDAERLAAIEKKVEASAYLKLTIAPKVDDWLAQGRRVSDELAIALDQARIAGVGEPHQSFLVEARLELERFVGMALDPVTGTGKVPSRMMKYTRWSECIPHPETAHPNPNKGV